MGNIKDGNILAIQLQSDATPDTPTAGFIKLYASGGLLYVIDENGDSTLVGGAGGFPPNAGARASVTGLTIPSAEYITIDFDTEIEDDGGYMDLNSYTDRFIAPVDGAGRYLVTVQMTFPSMASPDAGSVVEAQITVGGFEQFRHRVGAETFATDWGIYLTFSAIVPVDNSQRVQFIVYQSSGDSWDCSMIVTIQRLTNSLPTAGDMGGGQ